MTKGELFLSRPDDFNDAFDSFSSMSSKNHLEYWKSPMPLREAMKKHFAEEEVSLIFDHEDWRERLNEAIAKEVAEKNGMEPSQIIEALNNAVMRELISLNDTFNEMVRLSRIACFTESYTNLPMWAHYANNNQGICFEYDTSLFSYPLHSTRMFPILYGEKLPDAIHDLYQAKRKPPFGWIDSISMHKHSDWAYEREWRLIYSIGNFYFSPEDVPVDYSQKGKLISFTKPSRIYLGYNINADIENSIREIARGIGAEVAKLQLTPFGLGVE